MRLSPSSCPSSPPDAPCSMYVTHSNVQTFDMFKYSNVQLFEIFFNVRVYISTHILILHNVEIYIK
jgi:hypothetical protein